MTFTTSSYLFESNWKEASFWGAREKLQIRVAPADPDKFEIRLVVESAFCAFLEDRGWAEFGEKWLNVKPIVYNTKEKDIQDFTNSGQWANLLTNSESVKNTLNDINGIIKKRKYMEEKHC